MTEQEAIAVFEEILAIDYRDTIPKYYKAMELAVKDIKEIQQYRAIGTPEECRAAVEVKKEITEIVNRQLIAGKDNYKETYNCFYEIVKIIQDTILLRAQ